MTILDIVLPRAFKAQLPDPAFPLKHRFSDHRISEANVLFVGPTSQSGVLTLQNREWSFNVAAPLPSAPTVALITPNTLSVSTRDLQPLAGGNSNVNLALAARENPSLLLQQEYKPERTFHLVQLRGRRALVFGVKKTDVHAVGAETKANGSVLVRAACGLACAAQVAIADQPKSCPTATVLVVNDQRSVLTFRLAGDVSDPQCILLEDADAVEGLRKLVAEYAAETATARARARVAVYTTAAGILRSGDHLKSDEYDMECRDLNTADLCFA